MAATCAGRFFANKPGAFDILTIPRAVIERRMHAHITFSNPEGAMGGHIEEGCKVLTLATAAIAETPDTHLRE